MNLKTKAASLIFLSAMLILLLVLSSCGKPAVSKPADEANAASQNASSLVSPQEKSDAASAATDSVEQSQPQQQQTEQPRQETATKQAAEKPASQTAAAVQISEAKASAAEQSTTRKEAEKHDTVTVSIIGDDKHGVILPATETQAVEGATVLTIMELATRSHNIQMEYSGKGVTAYVKGIGNLYEFDRGAKSGWMFKVNGAFADKGVGLIKVKPGDRIEWLYTLNLGKDIGAKP